MTLSREPGPAFVFPCRADHSLGQANFGAQRPTRVLDPVRSNRFPKRHARIRINTARRLFGIMPGMRRGDAMLRKNITITSEQYEFLERHPEINQSALFRQIVEQMMIAERNPHLASIQNVKLGKAVYRSGAVMFQRTERRRAASE